MLTFPVVILGHILFIVAWLMAKSYKFLLSFVLLLFSFQISNRSFKFFKSKSKPTASTFSVLSYNVMYDDFFDWQTKINVQNGLDLVNSIDTLTADIKCFQELYNREDFPEFNVLKKITQHSKNYVYMHSSKESMNGQGTIGLAIFSKFPIIHKDEVYWKLNNNGLLLADIVIRKDTIRVINVQLKSMGIRVRKIINEKNQFDEEETKDILSKLKYGFKVRTVEVDELENWIKQSPYPVIVAGDFNELPYGYAYGRVRKRLNNAFEDSGFGFGFTYHKILTFLRIDNQFYDKEFIENIGFETIQSVPFSDHYPIRGFYNLRN